MIGNPFYYRAADSKLGNLSDIRRFVNLFGVDVLSLLKKKIQTVWDIPLLLLSAPGAGKSSLMRIFCTKSIRYILESAPSGGNQEILADRLEELGAIRNNSIYALGIWLKMSDEYHPLDLGGSQKQNGLFFALLNSRIILSMLLGIGDLVNMDPYENLEKVEIKIKSTASSHTIESWKKWGSKSGSDLYHKMSDLEARICEMMDNPFWNGDPSELSSSKIWSLDLLADIEVYVEGKHIPFKPLVMLDDVHELTENQSKYLLSLSVSRQIKVPFWIALRKQALSLEVLLTQQLDKGVESGRDYEFIDLDGFRNNRKTFKNLVLHVSTLRVNDVASKIGTLSHEFIHFISDNRSDVIFLNILNKEVVTELRNRIIENAGDEVDRYIEVIDSIFNGNDENHIKCRKLRNLAVLIKRDLLKPQLAFSFEKFELDKLRNEDNKKKYGNVEELFLSQEYKLPYYFGSSKLITLSSYNILQFLRLAGALFEEVMVAISLGRDRESFLSPERQHSIISKEAKKYLKRIPRSVRFGNEVYRLVHAVGDMCRSETYRPTAPYGPGVTGFAISMYDLNILTEKAKDNDNDHLVLLRVIESAIAHNVFEPHPNYKCKGQNLLVLYFNRLLCVPFKLPLQKGGFREQKLETLFNWLKRGYTKRSSNINQKELW